MYHRLLLTIFFLVTITSCVYPVKVTSECQRRIHSCLKNCESRVDENQIYPDGDTLPDTKDKRSPCERSCHSLCQQS